MAFCQCGVTLQKETPPPLFKAHGMFVYMQIFPPIVWVLCHQGVGALAPFVGATVWTVLVDPNFVGPDSSCVIKKKTSHYVSSERRNSNGKFPSF